MNRHLTLAALAGAASFIGLAQAQAQDWTGPYVGVHAGLADQANDDDAESVRFDTNLDGTSGDTVFTSAGANAFSPGFCNGPAANTTPAGGCGEDDGGGDIGLRAGWDWQFGSWVFGVVADVSGVDVQDSVSAFSTTPASYTFRRELEGIASARVRAGYARDSYLGYVTGGVAKAQIDHSFSSTNVVNTFTEDEDDKVGGYQLGAGIEARVADKVTVGVEYMFTSLEDDDYRVRASGPAPGGNAFLLTNAAGTDFSRSDEDFEIHSVRLTASYRFR